MSSQPVPHHQARLFGLDLRALWRDLANAWRGMLDWPLFSWFWPQPAVRLYLATGGLALSRGLTTAPLQDESGARAALFGAIVLPESVLLRRTLEVPRLMPAELLAALALEVQNLSPFAPDDLAWTHEVSPRAGNSLRVDVALTSRKLAVQHAQAVHPQFAFENPEMWVSRCSGPGFVMLPGFGEARRQRRDVAGRWISAMLALLVLALVAAMALTPSVQLYLRAQQAYQAMSAMQRKAGGVIAQRELLVQKSDQLTALAELSGKTVPTLAALKLITEALPDDTSLLSLQIQGSKVSMTGQTVNAAALMKQLGSTPGLREVKAPTPATKPLGAPRESFTIEFMLDPAQPKPAS